MQLERMKEQNDSLKVSAIKLNMHILSVEQKHLQVKTPGLFKSKII